MKKYSIVLLIAVLAVSSVFAGFSGYLDAKYVINFDKGNFQYSTPNDKLDASIKFDDVIGKKTGEGKAYIDAAASLTWQSKAKNKDGDGSRFVLDQLGYFKLSIDKLMIVGNNWSLNLKEAEKLGGYANSTLDFHTWYRHDHLKKGGVNDGAKAWAAYNTASDFDVFTADYPDTPTDAFKKARDYAVGSYLQPKAGVDGVITETDYSTDTDNYLGLTYKDDYAEYAKKVAYGVGYDFYDDDDEDFGMHGVTFNWKGYKLALAINGDLGDYDGKKRSNTRNYYFGVETKEFDLEGLKLQGAVGVSYRDNAIDFKTTATDGGVGSAYFTHADKWVIGGSFKASYANDKFSASVATDQMIETYGGHSFENKPTPEYNGDVMVQAQFAPVSAEIFFAKKAKSQKGADKDYTIGDKDKGNGDFVQTKRKYYFSEQGVYKKNTVENMLSFQVKGDLNQYDIPVTLTFQGLNMINDARIFNVIADSTLLDGDLKLQAYAKDLFASYDNIKKKAYYQGTEDFGSYIYWDENGSKQKIGVKADYAVCDAVDTTAEVFTKLGKKTVGAKLGATYKADLFTANANIEAEFDTRSKTQVGKDGLEGKDFNKMQLVVGATSDKLVNGAILSVEYKSGNVLGTKKGQYDWCVGQEAGKLTTKCRVVF